MTFDWNFFPREAPQTDKYSCEIGHAFSNPPLKIKVLSYSASLICGIISASLGSSLPDKYSYETLKPIFLMGAWV